jgi:hypothetical protein
MSLTLDFGVVTGIGTQKVAGVENIKILYEEKGKADEEAKQVSEFILIVFVRVLKGHYRSHMMLRR